MEQKNLSTVEKIIFLKSVDIFQHAAVEELGRVAGLMEEVRFEAGQAIYRVGEPVEAIYIILSGQAVVEGNGRIIYEVGGKETLGLFAALDRNMAPHTITVTQPLHALKLNSQEFEDILSVDFDLVKAVFRAMAQRIRLVS